MERVYQNRLAWGHVEPCPRCIGQIAVLDRAHLGKHAYITRPGHAPEGPYLIVDVAAAKDRERLRARGLVAEVNYQTAARFGMLAGPREGVRVFVMSDHR